LITINLGNQPPAGPTQRDPARDPAVKGRNRFATPVVALGVLALAVAVACAWVLWAQGNREAALSMRLETAQTDSAMLERGATARDSLAALTELASRAGEAANRLEELRLVWPVFLASLPLHVPDSVWLTGITVDPVEDSGATDALLEIQGFGAALLDVTDFHRKLHDWAQLTDVRILGTQRSPAGGYAFAVSARLVSAPASGSGVD